MWSSRALSTCIWQRKGSGRTGKRIFSAVVFRRQPVIFRTSWLKASWRGARIEYDAPSGEGIEQHNWLLEGVLIFSMNDQQ